MGSQRKCVGFFIALLLAAWLAGAQVVNVNPVPGNPVASGTNLLNALAGITSASATKPYVLRLAPGIYNIGVKPLIMKPWVDIEGSGQQSTIIRGRGNNVGFLTGVVQGASPAELRNLQVQCLGQGFDWGIAVLLNQANTSLRDVTLTASNAKSVWGLRNLGSSPIVQNVTINVTGGDSSYGIANAGGVFSTPVIRRAVINLSGAKQGNGIYSDQEATPVIRDAEISVSSSTAYGIRYFYFGVTFPPATLLEVTNSKIVAAGTTGASGIDLNGDLTVAVTHTNVTATGSGVGLKNSSSSFTSTFLVDHCDIKGSANSISAPFQTVRVGASKLDGPANIGAPACAASFNGSYAPLNASCL